MEKFWQTKSGDKIAIKDLEDSHLSNILNMIHNYAHNGMKISQGGGDTFEPESLWYEEYIIYGQDVYDRFDVYQDLVMEQKRRRSK